MMMARSRRASYLPQVNFEPQLSDTGQLSAPAELPDTCEKPLNITSAAAPHWGHDILFSRSLIFLSSLKTSRHFLHLYSYSGIPCFLHNSRAIIARVLSAGCPLHSRNAPFFFDLGQFLPSIHVITGFVFPLAKRIQH